jgi:lipopolysaccharide assembly outer membrane protein LptD (OstA)
MFKHALMLALVIGSSALLGAQAPKVEGDIVHMSGGVYVSTRDNVQVSADRAEFNQKTGEVLLTGNVVLRQELRPATQQIKATNNAGAPFPALKEVTMRVRGNFQISVGNLNVSAEEADINGLTGEMALRGNVRLTNPQWAGKQLFQ